MNYGHQHRSLVYSWLLGCLLYFSISGQLIAGHTSLRGTLFNTACGAYSSDMSAYPISIYVRTPDAGFDSGFHSYVTFASTIDTPGIGTVTGGADFNDNGFTVMWQYRSANGTVLLSGTKQMFSAVEDADAYTLLPQSYKIVVTAVNKDATEKGYILIDTNGAPRSGLNWLAPNSTKVLTLIINCYDGPMFLQEASMAYIGRDTNGVVITGVRTNGIPQPVGSPTAGDAFSGGFFTNAPPANANPQQYIPTATPQITYPNTNSTEKVVTGVEALYDQLGKILFQNGTFHTQTMAAVQYQSQNLYGISNQLGTLVYLTTNMLSTMRGMSNSGGFGTNSGNVIVTNSFAITNNFTFTNLLSVTNLPGTNVLDSGALSNQLGKIEGALTNVGPTNADSGSVTSAVSGLVGSIYSLTNFITPYEETAAAGASYPVEIGNVSVDLDFRNHPTVAPFFAAGKHLFLWAFTVVYVMAVVRLAKAQWDVLIVVPGSLPEGPVGLAWRAVSIGLLAVTVVVIPSWLTAWAGANTSTLALFFRNPFNLVLDHGSFPYFFILLDGLFPTGQVLSMFTSYCTIYVSLWAITAAAQVKTRVTG